ncbi:hypothetical protein QOZ80_2AG0105990 [Eleusine coracana subsp. coracana]|nr:hypothetical protein QOZ80_2AG0105990 [Eleusine coracana subsp. coracana]
MVTFWAVPPPALSHFAVYCPGIKRSPQQQHYYTWPLFVSDDADLAVLRVPRDSRSRSERFYKDYFVYRVNPQRHRLDLLPNPFPQFLHDNEIAVLSCSDGGYVVAALQVVPNLLNPTFTLHMYRSATDGKQQGAWTSRKLSVEDPLRDKVFPIPDSSNRVIFHNTTKVIVLGGDKASPLDSRVGRTLNRLLSTSDSNKDQEATLPLGCLSMAYPTLTVHDNNVLYFLSKSIIRGNIESVIAVDARKKTLDGLQVLDNKRVFMRQYHASGISRCLMAAQDDGGEEEDEDSNDEGCVSMSTI